MASDCVVDDNKKIFFSRSTHTATSGLSRITSMCTFYTPVLHDESL